MTHTSHIDFTYLLELREVPNLYQVRLHLQQKNNEISKSVGVDRMRLDNMTSLLAPEPPDLNRLDEPPVFAEPGAVAGSGF